jgi:hypothetical protein
MYDVNSLPKRNDCETFVYGSYEVDDFAARVAQICSNHCEYGDGRRHYHCHPLGSMVSFSANEQNHKELTGFIQASEGSSNLH